MAGLLTALVEAHELSVYSYVKPGAPHRYSTRFKDLHTLFVNLTSSFEVYEKAVTLGEDVARGRLGFPNVRVGELLGEAIQKSEARLGAGTDPMIHIMLIPVTVAVSYSMRMRNRVDPALVRRAISDLLSYSDVSDSLRIYESLKTVGGRYSSMLDETMVTPTKIRVESLRPADIFAEMSVKDPIFSFLGRRLSTLISSSKKFIELETGGMSINRAAVEVFSELVYGVTGNKLRVYGDTDIVRALRYDRELEKGGVDLSPFIGPLTAALFMGMADLITS